MVRIAGVVVLVLTGAGITFPAFGDTKTPPLLRGALWWVTSAYAEKSRDELAQVIDAQRAVGFDLLWLLNCPALAQQARNDASRDVLKTLYELADARGMHVIADLPQGGWYGKADEKTVVDAVKAEAQAFHAQYGAHPSFYGWYLNYEINPIAPEDTVQTTYWRAVWREISAECHRLAPKSVVTISPFFLLDKERKRGFVWQSPEEYAAWWGRTVGESGIDILMLQDSGEHLAFFTLADREPYFAATAKACHDAGRQFWVNVETGEADVRSWEELISLGSADKAPWRFTPMDWLSQKLALAAQYGDGIINWGYFPFMDPHPVGRGDAGFGVTPEKAKQAYEQYRGYYAAWKARTSP